MKRTPVWDREEGRLLAEYERGAFKPVPDHEKAKREAVDAARRYLRKDERINIRISTADLIMLKRRAAEEGLPYQTLITSILHKHVSRAAPRDR
jgi:predicted DNA binding CopG/RHH family protein